MTKTEVILSYINEQPATIRELQKITGFDTKIISGTITRLRSRGALIYISGWQRQNMGRREQWVAQWNVGKSKEADKKSPKGMDKKYHWKAAYHRQKAKIRASSVFAWCMNP